MFLSTGKLTSQADTTLIFFCFVEVGATLREARTSLGVTGILTEFTLDDVESNGIPKELLPGQPFKLFDGAGKLLTVAPVVTKSRQNYFSFQETFSYNTEFDESMNFSGFTQTYSGKIIMLLQEGKAMTF